jgi:hypothetical protein
MSNQTVSLTLPLSVLEKNDWKKFSSKMHQLGRLTDTEIEPITWRKAFSLVGIAPGGDLSKLIDKAEGKAYFLLIFAETDYKTAPQRITFGGSDDPIKFEI